MQRYLIRLLLVLVCGFLTAVSANAQSIHVEWGYTPPSEPAVTGFKLYQEGTAVCQIGNADATSMDCEVTLTAATTNFTLTATFADNTESPHSAPFTFTTEIATQAVLQATPVSGTTPLTVAFSATSSTGAIAQYQWDFGDGSVADTSTAGHAYTSAGSYTAQLTVTDSSATSSTATTAITVTTSAELQTPPTAVISSSTAAGAAPLSVSFDGSTSQASGTATIAGYAWSFGDGSTAAGAETTHSFIATGTYETGLTVTDTNGLTGSGTTPVVVTAGTTNAAPTAALTATPDAGSAPLTVTFDGSASADSDGSIVSYTWSFGDGSSGSGQTVTHAYTTEATFTATLEVTDDQGAIGSATKTITVQPQATSLALETGEVTVTGEWVRVSLSSTFQNPIVVAGPTSYNDPDPGVIRLRNVDATGFDIKFTEWNSLDGAHPQETVSYIVMEKGRHTLADGSIVEAGSFTGTTKWATVSFSQALNATPVVLTTIASMNETDTISGRIKVVAPTGFAYYFREQEKNTNKHAKETVNYIAWEPGEGSLGTMQYRVAATANAVNHKWYTITFPSAYAAPPLVLADMQTTAGGEPAGLRIRNLSAARFQVKVEEEQSKDTEVRHAAEAVGYIALTVSSSSAEAGVIPVEIGEATVTSEWGRVSFTATFQDPVVIAGPASCNDAEPGVVRLRNIDATGFDIKFAEWEYLDQTHPKESVSYIVLEKGRHTLANGSVVEAGSFAGTTQWATIPFSQTFSQKPVVLTTIASMNEADTISGRVKGISTTSFAYTFFEQEKNANEHAKETVNYIAWEPGEGSLGAQQYQVITTNAVTHKWYPITFPTASPTAPLVLADMQTTAGGDPSTLRMKERSTSGFQLKVEEEQSKDTEVGHAAEGVGCIFLR